ncbi:MAG: right-handed parallel beta-helix repeat-containing protein [Verrucomicrobia bacterium]|nr:right-handed parallel beta-helix repeat-containing protein [Verrucomicrobiota bacterium]
MHQHLTSYLCITLSAALICHTLTAEEKPCDDLTASIFGLGASTPKDTTQKANTAEEGSCKVKLEKCSPDVPSQLLYFKHIEAKGIGYKKGYSTVGAFLTPYTMFADFLPFADLRGHVFNDGKFAANAGLGVKYLSNHPFVFGAGVYYDFRQARKTHFNQVSLGLETLARRWEARLNGYLPVGSKKHVQTKSQSVGYNFDHFAGHHLFYNETFFVKKRTEFAMKGADAEFGWHLLKPQEDYTLYAAAGPYYYNGERKHAWGGKVRVEGRITPYVTLEVSDSYDNIFHNIVQGQVSINVPFGGKIQKKNGRFKTSCSTALSMEARMMRPLYRQEIIVADTERKHFFKTVDPLALSPQGEPINILFVNPNSTGPGDGTFENPYALLTDAQAASLPGDVFYVYPGNISLTSSFVLIDNQSLLGSSTAQTVPVLVAPHQVIALTIPAQTSGLPIITGNGTNGKAVIHFNGDKVIISGFNIIQNDTNAIIDNFFLPTFDYLPISDVTIMNNILTQNVQSDGILFRSISGNNILSNNTFENNGNGLHGISIDQEGLTTGSFSITRNTINQWNNGDGAIFVRTNTNDFEGAKLTINIQDNNLNNSLNGGGISIISFGNSLINATINNNIIINNSGDGIFLNSFNQSTINANVFQNTCNNNKDFGIKFDPHDNSTMNVVFTQNILNSNNQAGIGFNFTFAQFMTDVSITATIDRNTCNKNLGTGMYFETDGSNVSNMHFTISNNSIIGNGDSMIGNGYTVFVENPADAATCLKLINNNNTWFYGLQNDSLNTGSYKLESPSGNTGEIFLLNSSGSGSPIPLFEIVEMGTCAP